MDFFTLSELLSDFAIGYRDCRDCGEPSNTWSFVVPPEIFIIQLPRFTDSKKKNRVLIFFHETLHHPLLAYHYKLYAVLSHYGISPHSGHYKAFVLRGSEWFVCDDSTVESANFEKDILNENAYALFYYQVGANKLYNPIDVGAHDQGSADKVTYQEMLDSESDDSDNDAVSANSFHGDHPQNYVDDLDDVIDDNDGIAASRDEDDDDAKFYDQFCPAPDGDEDCDEDEDEPLVLTDSETESLLQHLDTIELLSMARDAFEGDKGFQDSDNGLKILTGALASYDAHANGLAIAVQEFFEVKFKADPSNPELQQRLARLQVSKEKNCELNIDQAEACLGAIWPKDLVKQWRKNFDAVIERMQQEDSKADVVEEADSIQW